MTGMRIAHKILVGISEGKSLCAKPKHRWVGNTEIIIK
jgi:hypothetical protein